MTKPAAQVFRVVLLLLFYVAAATVVAQDPREIALAEIRVEIARLEERLTVVRQREAGLESELEQLDVELELQEIQVREATTAHDLMAARVAATENKIAELEATLADLRDAFKRRLSGLYRLGRRGYLRLFLALEPDQDLLPAIRQLRFLVRRDQALIERYVETRRQLEEERQLLESRRLERAAWQERESERRDQLVRLRRRRERLLEKVMIERRQLAERSDRLQDKEQKLSRLIGSLTGITPLDGTPIQEFRGALDWPLEGEIVAGFGPRLDPRYRTEVPHNGVDIVMEPEGRPPVKAIFPGEVLFAGPFEGYGLMVVAHHPGRVFTLYAGLEDLQVAKGDMLSLGQVLGTVAERLYFELRHENQPEDPVDWLR